MLLLIDVYILECECDVELCVIADAVSHEVISKISS